MTSDIEKKLGYGTLALHAGHEPDAHTGARAVPICQTTSYAFRDTEHAANLFALKEPGYIYTRLNNPTTDVLENRMAAMEGGIGGVAFSSGQQAITVSLLNLVQSGQHIIAQAALYGGTLTLLGSTFKRLGIEVTFVDTTDPKNIAAAIRPETRAVYIESVANPKNDVLDYPEICRVAHEAGIPVICDNTATPMIFRPIEHGIDIVMYSTTKFVGGHGTSIGGMLIDSGNFDWTAKPEMWPQFNTPDPSYGGIVFSEALGPAAYIARTRTHLLRDMGGVMSPFNAFLFLQGVETLHLRMPRHCENALALAQFLDAHPMVEWVNFPGLPSHPCHENAKRFLKGGFGAILGFGLKGGRASGQKFIESVELATHLANIGDAKTLVIHPASTTHSQQNEEELVAAGISDDYVRVSVGIEDIDDIRDDFDQALKAACS